MAKYLVFSDSHGRQERMLEIIKNTPGVEGIFFLGDLEDNDDQFRRCFPGPVYMVRGNCDYMSKAPERLVLELEGHVIAMAHGHRHYVSMSLDNIKYWGLESGADLVMYGHTHVPHLEYSNAMTVLNPGSISKPRQEGHKPTYAVLEFAENGQIVAEICEC